MVVAVVAAMWEAVAAATAMAVAAPTAKAIAAQTAKAPPICRASETGRPIRRMAPHTDAMA
jgi:hypothetical protein